MNPEISWRHQRENINHLLARMTLDPDFKQLVFRDPMTALGSYSYAPIELISGSRQMRPPKY